MNNAATVTPEIGMGATEFRGSDRRPLTVVEILGPKTVVVQSDRAERTDGNGLSDNQSYKYSRNPEGPKETITLRSNGWWVAKGLSVKDGCRVAVGHRDSHHDFTF